MHMSNVTYGSKITLCSKVFCKSGPLCPKCVCSQILFIALFLQGVHVQGAGRE